jgi:protein-S-isoprenylcysteine O-methyltransferase Ste14
MVSWSGLARRIRVPLGFALAILYAWLSAPTGMSILAGACFIAPGLWIRALASGHVRKNEQLTTTGPYAYTRNPLYLGSIFLGIGFAIAARSVWISLAMILLFVGIYLPVIQSEEHYLRARFAEFEDYARRVPRLIPRPFGQRAGKEAFSWSLYVRHREYNALAGAAAMMAVLAAKLLWWKK